MGTYTTQWEDDDNNRILELSVQYTLNGSDLAITHVTPASVSFVDPGSREVVRKIGVHTAKGRHFLLRLFDAKVGHGRLHQELSDTLLATA